MKLVNIFLTTGAGLLAFNMAVAAQAEVSAATDTASEIEQTQKVEKEWDRKNPQEQFMALVERARSHFEMAISPQLDPNWKEFTSNGRMDSVDVSMMHLQQFFYAVDSANRMFIDDKKRWNAEEFLSLTPQEFNENMQDLLLRHAVLLMGRIQKENTSGSYAIWMVKKVEDYLDQRKRYYGAADKKWEMVGETQESINQLLIRNHRKEAQSVLELSGNDPDYRGSLGLWIIQEAGSHVGVAAKIAGTKAQWEDIGWTQDRINELTARHRLAIARIDLDGAKSGFDESSSFHWEMSPQERLSNIKAAKQAIEGATVNGNSPGWHLVVSSQHEIDELVRELGGNPAEYSFNQPQQKPGPVPQ